MENIKKYTRSIGTCIYETSYFKHGWNVDENAFNQNDVAAHKFILEETSGHNTAIYPVLELKQVKVHY